MAKKNQKKIAPKKTKYVFAYYLVGFIDLLGQKDSLTNLELFNIPEEKEKFDNAVFSTVITVEAFRESVRTWFKKIKNSKSFKEEFEKAFKNLVKNKSKKEVTRLKAHKASYEKMQRSDLNFQVFSDSIVFYCSLIDENKRIPFIDIFSMLVAIGFTKLIFMTQGKFFRGGLEIGCGTLLGKDGFYGNALNRAYYLESEIAKYPRIVIGTQFKKYLEDMRRYQNSLETEDFDSRFRDTYLKFVESLILKDTDEQFILNYLNSDILTLFSLDPQILQNAYMSIHKEAENFQQKGDSKHFERYKKLKAFFEESIPEEFKKNLSK